MARHRWKTYSGKGRRVPKRITDKEEAYLWASDYRKSNIDSFSDESASHGHHNGPICIDCGAGGCWHCDRSRLVEECSVGSASATTEGQP